MVRLEQLVERLNTLNKISNEEWIAKLNEKKLKEIEFHVLHRDENQIKFLD